MASVYGKRFNELLKQAEAIEGSKRTHRSEYMGEGIYVDQAVLLNWQVKVRDLLSSLCGFESQYFKSFVESEKPMTMTTNHELFKNMRAVFLAAKEDYESGYLHSLRDTVQAEVFDSELEQADELLASHFYTAAAVIAGVVLETRLRQLCVDRGIPIGKLDKMNADLAKADIYNKLTQKRITTWAGLRNSAAHGKTEEFTPADVTNMVRDVRELLATKLL